MRGKDHGIKTDERRRAKRRAQRSRKEAEDLVTRLDGAGN